MPKLDLKTELISLPTDPAFLEAKNADFKNINQNEKNSAKKIQKLSNEEFVKKFGNYFQIMSFLDNVVQECWTNLSLQKEKSNILNNALKKLNNSPIYDKKSQTKEFLIKFFQKLKESNNSSVQVNARKKQPRENFFDKKDNPQRINLNNKISKIFENDFEEAVLSLFELFQENSEILSEIHLANAIFRLGKKDTKNSKNGEKKAKHFKKINFFKKHQEYLKRLFDCLTNIIPNLYFGHQEISNFGFGLQDLSDKIVSRELLEELGEQMSNVQLSPKEIRYFCSGLQNLSDKVVSKELIEEIRKQIEGLKKEKVKLEYTEIGYIGYSLKNLSDKVVSKELLEELRLQIQETQLSPRSIGYFGYGLQNLSDKVVSKELLEELGKQMSRVKLSPKDIRHFSYGLQNLSDKVVSKELLEELRKQMSNMRLSSNRIKLSPQGIGNFGYGLQNLSDEVVSKELLEELQKQMENKQLTSQGIGNFLYGINRLKSEKAEEIRKLLGQKTAEIPEKKFEEKGIIALMQGFAINDLTPPQNLQSAYENFILTETKNTDFINQTEAIAWNILSPKFNDLKHNVYYNGFELDFYSPAKKLNIEIDGCYHNPIKDAKRDCYLKKQGIQVIRINLLSEDWQAQLAQIS